MRKPFKPTHRVKFHPTVVDMSSRVQTIEVRETERFYCDDHGRKFRKRHPGSRCDAGRNIWRPERIDLSTLEPIK